MFVYTDTVASEQGSVHVGFTDNRLNFAEAQPVTNRTRSQQRLEQHCGARVIRMDQCHGNDVAVVTEHTDLELLAGVDGVVTTRSDVALVARGADCVPVLLGDHEAGVVAAVHSGRVGTALGVVPRAVEVLRAHGALDLRAWIGPHICGRCYEVEAHVRESFSQQVPHSWSETSWATPALDLGAAVAHQLARADVGVTSTGLCTFERSDLPSHRRDRGTAGRLAGIIWRTEP